MIWHFIWGFIVVFTATSVLTAMLITLADALRINLMRNPFVSKTKGWRCWVWLEHERRLYSPYFKMRWEERAMRAENWDQYYLWRLTKDSLEVHPEGWFGPGINAAFVPFGWKWLRNSQVERAGIDMPYSWGNDSQLYGYPVVRGIVERYGEYVQGTKGWRSEWAVIKELYTPDKAVAAELRKAYPDVKVTTK